MLKQWWGPEHFTSPVAKLEPFVGGRVLLAMQSPDGEVYWSGGVVKEYDPPARLAWTDHFADEYGNVISPEAYGLGADFPAESLLTITFESLADGKTKLTMITDTPVEVAESAGAVEGWSTSLDKLQRVVEAAAEAAG